MPQPPDLAPGRRCAALLRAVNVGGRKLKMAELRALLVEHGFQDVQTLLASGNVVLRVPESGAEGLSARLTEVIEQGFGLHSPVVLRGHSTLAEALARHPYRDDEEKAARLHVVFLQSQPDPARVSAMDPNHSPPDRFAVAGREVFLHYPEGSGRSKLTLDWIERQLGVVGTGRNLNTVAKLAEMTTPSD